MSSLLSFLSSATNAIDLYSQVNNDKNFKELFSILGEFNLKELSKLFIKNTLYTIGQDMLLFNDFLDNTKDSPYVTRYIAVVDNVRKIFEYVDKKVEIIDVTYSDNTKDTITSARKEIKDWLVQFFSSEVNKTCHGDINNLRVVYVAIVDYVAEFNSELISFLIPSLNERFTVGDNAKMIKEFSTLVGYFNEVINKKFYDGKPAIISTTSGDLPFGWCGTDNLIDPTTNKRYNDSSNKTPNNTPDDTSDNPPDDTSDDTKDNLTNNTTKNSMSDDTTTKNRRIYYYNPPNDTIQNNIFDDTTTKNHRSTTATDSLIETKILTSPNHIITSKKWDSSIEEFRNKFSLGDELNKKKRKCNDDINDNTNKKQDREDK